MLNRKKRQSEKAREFIEKAELIRKKHPEMGCRKMALTLRSAGFGRDKLERILLESGFRVTYPPNYIKTTQRARINKFQNLIKGLEVNGINQVIQTDITYFDMNGSHGYLVFIIDVYSRRVTGYEASEGLESSANMKALKMMIALRGVASVKGLIHHSDKGSQHHEKKYLKTLMDHSINVSMCDQAWENAYTERLNRTMKNEYLRHRNIKSIEQLKKWLAHDVKAYNEDRPHWKLPGQMSPVAFEKYIQNIPKRLRPKMTLYQNKKNIQNEFFLAIQQSDKK